MTIKKQVRRFDYDGQITSIEKTPQGFLKVPGFATRTGVFPYIEASGKTRRELRHPDDVFAPESLQTLKNAVVTLEHPPVMITPENFRMYSKGYTTDRVEVNRDLVETDVIVADEGAIDQVENNGLRELSSGYLCDLVAETGEWNGAPYDFRQTNIRYNHIALTKSGRGGPEVRLRMDSADAVMQAPEAKEEGSTKDIVIGGEVVSLPPRIADIVSSLLDRYDQMRGENQQDETKGKRTDMDINITNIKPGVDVVQSIPDGITATKKSGPSVQAAPAQPSMKVDAEKENPFSEDKKEEKKDDDTMASVAGGEGNLNVKTTAVDPTKLSQIQAAIDAVQAMLDEMTSDKKLPSDETKVMPANNGDAPVMKMDSAPVRSLIKNRVKLEKLSSKFVPQSVSDRFDSMSDDQIRAAVIVGKHPKADLSGKSSSYLQVRFDSIVEAHDESEEVRVAMGSHLMSARNDSKDINLDAARRRMVEAAREEWKQPLTTVKK